MKYTLMLNIIITPHIHATTKTAHIKILYMLLLTDTLKKLYHIIIGELTATN